MYFMNIVKGDITKITGGNRKRCQQLTRRQGGVFGEIHRVEEREFLVEC